MEMEEFRGRSKEEEKEKISIPFPADRLMVLHLFHTLILNFLVDFLRDADQEGIPDFANVEPIASFEGIKPVASDAALVCD